MKRTIALLSAGLALVLAAAAVPARADDVKDLKATARALAEKAHKTVVTVRLVLKVNMGGGEREVKVERTGTVIDASGLTVLSAQAVEPSIGGGAGARGGRGGRGGAGGGAGGAAPEIKIDVAETSLVLEDGTEVESDVVLKDQELDLAFIRPRDAQTKLDFVTLKARGTPPALLDDVIVVGRLGRTANRAASVSLGTVKAVVKGPRTYCVCDDELSSNSEGCVAYGADGSTLGVFVTKRSSEGGRGAAGGGAIMILRSVEDLIEIAAQARTAKAPEKKADAQEQGDKDKGDKDKAEKKDGTAKEAPKDTKDAPKGDSRKPTKKDDEGD